jgi:uncharacterized membrane protein YkgB
MLSPPVVCRHPASSGSTPTRNERRAAEWGPERSLRRLRKETPTYSILYIIGAIVVIVVVLKVLGLF